MLLTLEIVSLPWQLMTGRQRQADCCRAGLYGNKRALLKGGVSYCLHMSDLEPCCLVKF